MTTVEITVGGATIKVEPATSHAATVYNVGVSSSQAVIQRIEEQERRASKSNPPTPPSLPVDDAAFEPADGRDNHRQDRGEVPVSVTSALLTCLYESLVQRGSDGHVGGKHIGEGGAELFRGRRGSGSVAEVAHDSSPSSRCGDTTVGDGGGPGGRIEQPGPAPTVILGRFMDALGVAPAAPEECAEFFLRGDDVGQVFGLESVAYLRWAYALAGEFQLAPYQAGLLIDALATALAGAR